MKISKKNNEKLEKILNNNNTNGQKAEKTSNNNNSNNQKEENILNNSNSNNQKSRKALNNNNDNESKNIIINKILIYILLYFMRYKSYKFYFKKIFYNKNTINYTIFFQHQEKHFF